VTKSGAAVLGVR
jgi:hypothetical protein